MPTSKNEKVIRQLLSVRTASYDMHDGGDRFWPFEYNSRIPLFHSVWIGRMLSDQRIQFGLRMIKGPLLSNARFFVRTDDAALKQFLVRNIERFWTFSASKALRAVEWGYSGSEALYRIHDDKIYFDSLKILRPRDIRVVIRDGEKVGVSLARSKSNTGRIYLGGPKALWHIHNREENPYYGLSRLYGAFPPWFEMHTDGGAKDVRKLYYRKYAFSGETLYFPPGDPPFPSSDPNTSSSTGAYSNKGIAQHIVEKRRTGGTVVLPSTFHENGQRKWELVPASSGPGSIDILEYHRMLKAEMFEGMGIPNEIAEAAETGSGWSGRRVPQQAFNSTLQEIVNWLMFDFDQQILRSLVQLNFDTELEYDIIPFGFLQENEKPEATPEPTGTGLPGEQVNP